MTRATRSLLMAIALSASLTLSGAEPMSHRQAREIIDSRATDPITGIWKFGGDGATIAILPVNGSSSTFNIFLLDSPDLSVLPGELIGDAATTGDIATYDASIKSSSGIAKRRNKSILTIDKDGRLSIKPYKQGKSIKLWRWIPYLFRVSVSDRDTRPDGVDGAVKIYPSNMPSGPTLL